MPGPETVAVQRGLRAMASPAVIDAALAAGLGDTLDELGAEPLRLAPDDLLVLSTGNGWHWGSHDELRAALEDALLPGDPHLLVDEEAGFAGRGGNAEAVRRWVAANADWLLPDGDGFHQGQVAGLPVKIRVQSSWAMVLVPTPIAHELAERLGPDGGLERPA